MKGKIFSFLALNRFNFGGRTIHQFIIFEHKRIGSLLFFWFHKSDKVQDRFHTHAFNALSFKLYGSYDEHIINENEPNLIKTNERKSIIKYFPRDSFHAIGKSKEGCLTMLISGPWKPTWKEKVGNSIITYNWNRTILKEETC